ncbi:MAG: sensor histidine kinase [Sphingobacteriaceae bacterium]|nr:MAG: sensor histidine kinase [Sphingobacteriaceae bacterium]
MSQQLPASIQKDIENVSHIPVIATILEVICRTTKMGFAAVARVTDDKWVACAVRDEIAFGLVPGGELTLETTICHEIRQNHKAVIIDHVSEDEVYSCHHTPTMYGFQSYISMPIMLKNGTFFGTLCAIDPTPAKLKTTETIGMFQLFAELISFHLDAIEQLVSSEAKLTEERKTAELRDQFIAILGHDLLNPVGAVLNAAQLLLRIPADERVKRIANIVQSSSYRMKGLIENILDFARGRLGEGIILNSNADESIESLLNHVITELRIVWPDSTINATYELNEPVNCDGKRIAQLFSNLLGNALTHGDNNTPVSVLAKSGDGEFSISVTNAGNKIPDAAMDRLFQPFSRGEIVPNKQGLGLGLYIASEIARAHGGTLEVVSTGTETCFTLRIPSC